MIITQHLVMTRGDSRDIILTMPSGAALDLAQSVRFTTRDSDDDVVWEQTLTPSSDTVATATIGTADWTAWEDDSDEPSEMHFDFEVVDAAGDTHTVGRGIIKVVSDQSR